MLGHDRKNLARYSTMGKMGIPKTKNPKHYTIVTSLSLHFQTFQAILGGFVIISVHFLPNLAIFASKKVS